jgi:hypothetical protein
MADTTTGQSSSGWHRIAKFIECPQAFSYRERLGLRARVEKIEPATGTVLHEGLRAWYDGEAHDRETVVTTMRAMPSRFGPAISHALALFDRYLRRYPNEDFDVLATEVEVEVTLAGLPFTRRIDLVVREHRGGRVRIYDHKTASQPKRRASSAALDWSLMTQELVLACQCASLFDAEYGGFVLNLIGTASEEFIRVPLSFNSRMMAALPRSLHYYLTRINELEQTTDPWEYPRSGGCLGRYGVCEYKAICEYGKAAARLEFSCAFDDDVDCA